MYIFDFIKSLFKKEKIGIFIWILMNIALIMALFSGGFQDMAGAWVGLGLYLVSLVIALSPIGEFILRVQNGCKKIKDPDILARIEPLFNEVYAKAKKMNPELPNKIKMYINNSEEPNAFATGRKTVCVTRGLLTYNDEQIKGVLAHEFGHLANNDTDTILVVAVGNLIVSIIFVVIRVLANIFMICGEFMTAAFGRGIGGLIATFFVMISRVIADLILVLLMRLWTQIGVWLCMYSSRKNEFKADEFSVKCGYGTGLCQVLASFGVTPSQGLFASLASSHPKTQLRIQKIEELCRG